MWFTTTNTAARPRMPSRPESRSRVTVGSRAERAEEPVPEGAHRPDRRGRVGTQPVDPAPAGDPAHHRRVLGDDGDRHVVTGVPRDDPRRLLVAEDDEHEVLV